MLRIFNGNLGLDFWKLWLGRTISEFGSGITGTALPLMAVLVLAATPAQMGLLSALEAAPVLLVGLLAGVWADRLPRRPILIACDVGRAILLGSIPLAALLGLLRLGQLYVVVVLVGTLTVFFDVADQSLLPSLLAPERLVEGNSRLGISSSLAEIGGPGVAGVLVQAITAPLAIAVDAASFLCSALCVGLIRAPELAPSRQNQNVWREAREGLRVVLGHPLLRTLAGSSGAFNFFGNFIGTLYVLYAVRELHVSPAAVGLLIAAGGVGALIGSGVAGAVVRRCGLGVTLGGALGAASAGQVLMLAAHGPVAVSVALLMTAQLLGDVAIAVYLISEVSLRQALVPPHLLGRANASMQVLTTGIGPLGALLAGALGGLIGLRATLALGVCGIALASLYIFLSPLRALREHPAPETAPSTATS